jgi:hypothetical protein
MPAGRISGFVFLGISIIPLCFLIYTLFHLKQIGIPFFHPRVYVEAALFIGFLTAGIILIFKS